MDTANDFRILMAEHCVSELRNIAGNLKNVKKSAILNDINAKVMEIKYSYGEIDDLKPYLSSLKNLTAKLLDLLGGSNWIKKLRNMKYDDYKIAKIRFCLNILYNLDSRLKLPNDPAYAVDIRVGEVESVAKHPQAEKLKICNVNVGKIITVITNLENVKEGMKLPVALLPPVKLMGVVSEGMFLSDENKKENVGEIPELSEDELNNVRKEVLANLKLR